MWWVFINFSTLLMPLYEVSEKHLSVLSVKIWRQGELLIFSRKQM